MLPYHACIPLPGPMHGRERGRGRHYPCRRLSSARCPAILAEAPWPYGFLYMLGIVPANLHWRSTMRTHNLYCLLLMKSRTWVSIKHNLTQHNTTQHNRRGGKQITIFKVHLSGTRSAMVEGLQFDFHLFWAISRGYFNWLQHLQEFLFLKLKQVLPV